MRCRMRESDEWSGVSLSKVQPRKSRRDSESWQRHAIPRSESRILKVTDQQHSKVDTWRNARPSFLGIKLATLFFDPRIELLFGQQAVQPAIKRMAGRLRQRLRGDPEFRLRGLLFAEPIILLEKTNSVGYIIVVATRLIRTGFFNGLLKCAAPSGQTAAARCVRL